MGANAFPSVVKIDTDGICAVSKAIRVLRGFYNKK